MKKQILVKQEAVEKLSKVFQEAKTIVTFEYSGLTVDQFTQLRRELRQASCEVKVYKNNIARRAALGAGFDKFAEELTGPLAIATSSVDTVAPAKIVFDFSKKFKKIKIQTGVIEGVHASNEEIVSLASLPSRETLLTMLAAGLLAPVRDLAVGLNMLVEKDNN